MRSNGEYFPEGDDMIKSVFWRNYSEVVCEMDLEGMEIRSKIICELERVLAGQIVQLHTPDV